MKKEIWLGLIVVIVAAAVLAVAWRLPVTHEERTIIPVKKTFESVVVEDGNSVTQRLVLAPGTYSGVVLYADTDRLVGQPLVVVVRDSERRELARGQYAKVSYLPTNDDILRLEIPMARWQLTEPQHIFVEVWLKGSALSLRAAGMGELYRFGELIVGGEATQYDIALSLLVPERLGFGARQGVIAGLVVLLGLALVYLLPGERQRWWAVVILVAVVAPLALAGYWFSVDRLGIADWDYYFSLHHSYRYSLLQLKTFPFWNPYTCGGTAGLADPEFPVFTPTFLLELIFGISAGLRLAIYLSVMIGAWGMLALAKQLKLSPEAALLAAIVAAFGSVNLLEVTEGHVNVLAAMWIPWVFWAWLRAYRVHRASSTPGVSRRVGPLFCGIFLALTFFQGGIYLLMYTGLAFAALAFLAARPREAVMVTIKSGLWALGLAAVKLVPVLAWLRQFPDEAYAKSAYTLPWLTEILFGRHLHGAYVIFEQNSGWHEYGAYVGYIVFALALVGVSLAGRHRVIRALLIGGVLAAILSAMGPQLEPLFDQLWFFPRSNISRIILFSVMALALLAGFGLDHLRQRGVWPWVIVTLVGLAAIDIFSLSYQLSEKAFVLPEVVPQIEQAPEPIAFTTQRFDSAGRGSGTTRTYSAAQAGWGTMAYCSVLGPAPRVRTVSDEGGSELIGASKDEVSWALVNWSPNDVTVHVIVETEAEVTLNTNYARGWTVNGKPVKEVGGLVGADLEAGEYDVTFAYRTPGFWLGIIISVLTIGWAVRQVVSWAKRL